MDLELKPKARCICGCDNARRSEVLGSLIVAGIVIPKSDLNWLYEKGVRDSKILSKSKINNLGKFLKEKYETTVFRISAKEINNNNINKLEAKCVLRIVEKYYNKVIKFYIDAIGARTDLIYRYEGKFNDYSDKIIIEPKADSKFIATMAASIIAKYHSNAETAYLKDKYNCGSGTCSDPQTLKYILNNLDNKKEIIRINWITYTRLKNNPILCKKLKKLIE